MQNLLRLAALLLAAAVLSGCGTMEKDRISTTMLATTDSYREALRWGYFEAAVDYLDPKTRATADLEGLDNVRVTGIEVVRPATITPDNRALRLVRIDYVLKDEQTLKQLMDRQDWRYDEERKAWFLHSGLPAF